MLKCCDVFGMLGELSEESVDLVVTDLPYESMEKHRKTGTTTRLKESKSSSNEWFKVFPNDKFGDLFAEFYRVLKKNSHLYMFCDSETSFIMKPEGEKAGFKFWKPIIWDKCLGPNTFVWTTRGTICIKDINIGDYVGIPKGGVSRVRGVRKVKAPARLIKLSDGTEIVASMDHKFVVNGINVEAQHLKGGDVFDKSSIRLKINTTLPLQKVIPDSDIVCEIPEGNVCLWCNKKFDSFRAASAHQSRFCKKARSKKEMAKIVGIKPKRMRRWFSNGRIPMIWAKKLGIEEYLTKRVGYYFQNNSDIWFPESINLDYNFGKFVGLFAAEGSFTPTGISFAFHANEKHLHHHIERQARALGICARKYIDGNKCVICINYKIARYIIEHFVGGYNAISKYFHDTVYSTSDEFRNGVLAGLFEGDGSWSSEEQRETLGLASIDLATFAHRELLQRNIKSTIHRFENNHAGGWRIRHDPKSIDNQNLTVKSVEDIGVVDLVDISIEDEDELFVLGNGAISHNCKIGMGYHYRARYEMIMFFEKGKRKLNNLSIPDVISVPRIWKGYPTEKPVEVSEILIKQSTSEGEVVLDPFMGSGSVGVAAVRNNRKFIGCDLSEKAYSIAKERINENT